MCGSGDGSAAPVPRNRGIDARYRTLPGVLSPHVGWKSDATWAAFVQAGVERILEALGTPRDG